jgi:Uma2 family endonuclease
MSTIARFSLAEYDRMIECGAFDEGRPRRLELIRGEIREMTPPGPLHEDVLDRLVEWSYENRPKRRVRIRVQNSIGIPELDTAPQPDLAWVARRDYGRRRPTVDDVLLLIEVSGSTLKFDRGLKAALYAEAGIADYWIVNTRDRVIEVYRNPQEGRYRRSNIHSGDDEVHPLAFPSIALRPAVLWTPSRPE